MHCCSSIAAAVARTPAALIACMASCALLPLLLSPHFAQLPSPLSVDDSTTRQVLAITRQSRAGDSRDRTAVVAARDGDRSTPEVARGASATSGFGSDGSGRLSAPAAVLKRASDQRLRALFRPAMTGSERRALLDCLRRLADALSVSGVEFFMYGGTLLGSYRHHGLVPWDDDADVAVSASRAGAVEQALASPSAFRCALYAHDPLRWKYFATGGGSSPIKGREWRWPFVDVCFFSDNGTHVYDVDPVYRDAFVYRREDVFPLAPRPLDGLVLPAPRDVRTVLEATYDPSMCATGTWSHRLEAPADGQRSVRCSRLHGVYPFVFRRSLTIEEDKRENHDGGQTTKGMAVVAVREELRIAGELVGEFLPAG